MPDWHELQDVVALHPEDIVTIPLDVGSDASVAAAAAVIAADTGSLNLLINNAGTVADRGGDNTLLDDLYFDDMLALYNINALGTLRVTKSVIHLLLQAGEKMVVNVSSAAASIGTITRTHQYGYTMSKTAINMQSKLIYNHFHKQGLEVRAIHPGWMHTRLFGGDLERMKNAPFEPDDAAKLVFASIFKPLRQEGHIFAENDGTPMPY
jgi:NAD(P)-dependent dehydrogenase (short-subunit alcohol dehydrogenase family)